MIVHLFNMRYFNEEGISWVSFTYKYKIDMKDIDFKLKEDEIEEA